MTDEEHENMCTAIEHALLTYNALADEAIRRNIRRWKVLPKFHAFTHYYYHKTNPRAFHCYLDEDFVGRLKRLVNGVCATGGTRTSRRAMSRYSVGVCLRWWDYMKTLRNIPVVHRKRGGDIVVEKDNHSLHESMMTKVKSKFR